MKKAIVHIGGHKTGSTAIQMVLRRNASLLAGRGIRYPLELVGDAWWAGGQHCIPLLMRGNNSLRRHLAQTDQDPLGCLAGLSRDMDLLLSSEEFMRLTGSEIATLARALDGFAIVVVLYVRRQDVAAQGLYQTQVMHQKYAEDFGAFFEKNKCLFDYFGIVREWEEACPGVRFVVRVYERSRLADSDVISDFAVVIREVLGRDVGYADWEKITGHPNYSFPSHVVALMKYFNGADKARRASAAIEVMANMIYPTSGSCSDLISPDERQKMLALYADSNRMLQERFFPGSGQIAPFDTDIQQTMTEWVDKYCWNGSHLTCFLNDARRMLQTLHAERHGSPCVENHFENDREWFQFSDQTLGHTGRIHRGPGDLEAPVTKPPPGRIQERTMQEPLWRTRLDRREFVPNYHDRPRPEALDRISWTPRCVVDIGCGGGGAARELLSRFPGARVYGLEHNAEAAAMARQRLHAVVCGDVESLDLAACGIPFDETDTVLLLDVLEHLVNPWGLLVRLRPLLPPGCRLVASIPNMANIALLDALAGGGFAYAENGLLDITHLRFFTARQMRELFAATGFTVLDMADVAQPSGLPQPLFRGPDHVGTARVTVKSRDQALLDDLFVLQKIVVAGTGPDPDFTPAPPPAAPAPQVFAASPTQALRAAYLDMVMHSVLGLVHEDASQNPGTGGTLPFDRSRRESGLDWPVSAHSMIGLARMRNVRELAEQALAQGVPGDFMETGVWRGGACIMFRAVLAAYGDATRRVIAADSFSGLPKPSPDRYPEDAGDEHHAFAELAVSLAQVQEHFRRYGLLDDQVVFLEGWFKDTLPTAPVERIAVLRLDGDMYESTINALENLYPRVSPGGFVIVDDYGYARSCRAAVDDYRRAHGIDEPMTAIDQFGVFWRTGGDVPRPAAAPAAPGASVVPAADPAAAAVPGNPGYCPCCRQRVVFEVRGAWLRDQYRCPRCESIPRQRALVLALDRFVPGWERLSLHEIDACHESIRRRSLAYTHSVLRMGDSPSGPLVQDLEALTLADASVDLVVLQDVLALVFRPDAALREIVRVLRPGGAFVFTLARDLGLPKSRCRVRRDPDGVLSYLTEPVRYGAPDNDKYLLKWDFGLDFEALAGAWSGCPVSGVLVRDPQLGLDGEYLEVFILRKPDLSQAMP